MSDYRSLESGEAEFKATEDGAGSAEAGKAREVKEGRQVTVKEFLDSTYRSTAEENWQVSIARLDADPTNVLPGQDPKKLRQDYVTQQGREQIMRELAQAYVRCVENLLQSTARYIESGARKKEVVDLCEGIQKDLRVAVNSAGASFNAKKDAVKSVCERYMPQVLKINDMCRYTLQTGIESLLKSLEKVGESVYSRVPAGISF